MSRISLSGKSSGNKAYRVVPDPDDPIILQLDGQLSQVLEISAVGFNAEDGLVAPGRRYPFSLDLPTSNRPISGYVDVLSDAADQENLACRFVNLSAEELESLHHYVLVRQKQAIRQLRRGRSGCLSG